MPTSTFPPLSIAALLQVTGGRADIVQDATSQVIYDDRIYVDGRPTHRSTDGAYAHITATNHSRAWVTQRTFVQLAF
jgi:hypothetical protein